MARIRLRLLGDKPVFEAFMADVEHLKKLPKEKIAAFLDWVVKLRVYQEAYTDEQWEKFRKTFDFKSIEGLNGAARFASGLLMAGASISRSELISDFEKLGFEQEYIKRIIDKLESVWPELDDWLEGQRYEAIPVLVSLRWRVDLRHSSSNYLKNPEVVVLLRIGTDDEGKKDQIYMELDKDKFSWLETVIGNIKREMLKAEEILNQTGIERTRLKT